MTDPHLPHGDDGLHLHYVTPEEMIGGVLLVAATALAGVQVISRSILGESFIWAEEAVVVLVVWAVFFGASAVTYRRLHIRMDILAVSVRSRLRPVVEIVASLVCLGYVLTVLYLGWEFLSFLRDSGETNPSMLVPQWILVLGFPIGMICMLIRIVQDLLRHVRALRAVHQKTS